MQASDGSVIDLALYEQDECRGWDVNEIVFSTGMWPMYHGLMRADFRLFDEYEHTHAGTGIGTAWTAICTSAELHIKPG